MLVEGDSSWHSISKFSMIKGHTTVHQDVLALGKGLSHVDDDYLQWKVKRQRPLKVNVHDLLSELKTCSRKRDLKEGRRVHKNAVESGNDSNMFVAAALIDMYAKCGSMVDARKVFHGIDEPDVVSWNALILGYATNGEGQVALSFFSRLKAASLCNPNPVTYLAAVKACTSLAVNEAGKRDCLKRGREIHLEIGFLVNHVLQNAFVSMYAKCGSMLDARRVFDNIQEPDVVSWTALILGYADNGEGQTALDCFSRMKAGARKCFPNSVTYLAAIQACTSLAADEAGKQECLKRGRELHLEIGHHMNRVVQNTLINMYAKCGSMLRSQQVFDSMNEPGVVSWNVLILGYANNGEGQGALDCFSRMKGKRGCAPNSVTYLAVIKAFASLAADEARKREYLARSQEMHAEIGHNMNHVLQNTLINMYAKFGSMDDAQRVFSNIEKPDVVSWNTLILGYADNGDSQTALNHFFRMKAAHGCAPDSITYLAAIKACGSIGALVTGRKLHSEITDFDVHVVTSLVDFYAKCGSMLEACKVFYLHSRARDVTTWTAMLAGYGRFGDSASVFNLFKEMLNQGFRPNAVTLLCMLLCCSHAGLVEKAREYLEAMPTQYRVAPTVMHYNCMVDVLGRSNQLDDAVALLQKMPCNPDAVTWMALLGACRKWKNAEIGRLAFQSLKKLDEKNAAAYVLMAEIYANRGMWKEQQRVLEERREVGALILPGVVYAMNGTGRMAKFAVGEKDPPELKQKMKHFLDGIEHGYNGELSIRPNVVDQPDKESLCGHSERRAVVYGILKTPPGEPVRAFKNTRMCDECHWATRIFSKLSRRVIIVRDDSRFHVMENGNCSCGE